MITLFLVRQQSQRNLPEIKYYYLYQSPLKRKYQSVFCVMLNRC